MKLIKLMLAFLLSCCALAQTDINCSKIEKNSSIIVVEFWASWNEANCVKFIDKISDCTTYRVDVEQYDTCMSEYSINSLPTLIVFDGKKEVCRWEADISFKLEIDKESVQKKVDELVLDKF
tara:strand:+ start:111 stop:476 length:366 start_codon:yes stop_codon:yes gene_type:complete